MHPVAPGSDKSQDQQPIVSTGAGGNRSKRTLSKRSTATIFVLFIALIGSYILLRTYAATPTQTKVWQTISDWSANSTLDHVTVADTGVSLTSASPVAEPLSSTASPTINVALDKHTVASSIQSSSFAASKAVDGKVNTRWASHLSWWWNGKDPEWIYVDLGKTYSISAVKLIWERAYGKAYAIQVSNDARTWTTIYTVSSGNGGTDDLKGLSGSGRYVRMYGRARGTHWGYSIREFQIYGSVGKVPPSPTPTYASRGVITLNFDADSGTSSTTAASWIAATPDASLPTGTTISYAYATSADNKTWSSWSSTPTQLAKSRYIRIQATLNTTNPSVTPTLHTLHLTYSIPTPTLVPPPAPTPTPTPLKPTVALISSLNAITAGSSAMLTWSASNATSCTASGSWSGIKATTGSISTGALTNTATFNLTCSGNGGTASATTTINVSTPPPPPSGLTAPSGYTNLVFDDTFSGTTLNTSTKWIEQMADQNGIWDDNGKLPYPYSSVGNEGGFNAEYGSPDQVVVDNGLSLHAQRSTAYSGYSWKAGYVTTHGKFTFSHGYFQVRAKLPDSTTGAWAGLWFLEGGGEIDLNESGYTSCGNSVVNQCIASNVHTSGNSQELYNTGVNLSTSYHTYGMEYKPGQYINMYFDGKQIAHYTANIPTGAYTIIMTETMAQNASSWHTLVSNATPSPLSPFQISEVQLWQ